MRILVLGDTHGRINAVLNKIKPLQFDYMLFTGDFIADARIIARSKMIQYKGVRGNCDPKTGKEEQVIEMGGKRFYLVHGHQYEVKKRYDLLQQRGSDLGADIVVFGHTHKAYCKKANDLWLVNPGSPSYPRTNSSTFVVITIREGQIFPDIIEL